MVRAYHVGDPACNSHVWEFFEKNKMQKDPKQRQLQLKTTKNTLVFRVSKNLNNEP